MNRVIPIPQSIHAGQVDGSVNIIRDFDAEFINRIVSLTNYG